MKELLPQRKIWAGGLAGAVLVLLLKVLKYYGIEFSGEEVAQLLVLITFAVQWLVPAADSDRPSPTPENPPNAA